MYAKLIDGRLVYAPNMLRAEQGDVYNPSADMLSDAGYKPVLETPYPETDSEFEVAYTATWQEQDGRIVQVWTECEETVDAPHVPTLDERVSILENIIANN